jgi:large conductance mechanosensitive channel
MKKLFEEFKKFISRGNVVDMAVGVAVAGAFTAIVNAFTKGFISPLLALLTNDSDLTSMKWVLREELIDSEGVVTQTEVAILWGGLVQAIIDFLIIAATLFLVMKIWAAVTKRAREINEQITKKVREQELAEKAAEEARVKAEEEAKAAEEAAKKQQEEAARAEEERKRAEALAEETRIAKEQREEELALLRKICESLQNK